MCRITHQNGSKVQEAAVRVRLVEGDHLLDEWLQQRRRLHANVPDSKAEGATAALHYPYIRLKGKKHIW